MGVVTVHAMILKSDVAFGSCASCTWDLDAGQTFYSE